MSAIRKGKVGYLTYHLPVRIRITLSLLRLGSDNETIAAIYVNEKEDDNNNNTNDEEEGGGNASAALVIRPRLSPIPPSQRNDSPKIPQ